jgi:hypothetical protein
MVKMTFYFDQERKKSGFIFSAFQIICTFKWHPIKNMKKEFSDTTALLSFFFSIPCKTNTIKSDQCKPGASRSSAGPHINFSRANNKLKSATNGGSDAKACNKGDELLTGRNAAFCDSLLALASVHRLEQ